jgi:uncharacterized protein HemX
MRLGQKHFSGVVTIAGRIMRAEVVVVVAVGLFCLLVGWHDADAIAQAFLIAGVLILAAGCAGIYTGRNEMQCAEHQYVQATMQVISDEELTRQNKPGMKQIAPQLIQSVILGGLTIGIGFVVDVLFG